MMFVKHSIVCTCLLILLICETMLCGCRENSTSVPFSATVVDTSDSPRVNSVLPEGLKYPVEALAKPSFFDSTSVNYRNVFPHPTDAEIICDGLREKISAEDPRLVRLINLLEYSWRDDRTVYLQGVISEEEAEQWFRESLPLLVIRFSEVPERDEYDYDSVDQILVCGAEILIYYHDDVNGVMIEDHWPCASYLWDMKESGLIPEEDYFTALDQAKETPWLDLLTYCGFR